MTAGDGGTGTAVDGGATDAGPGPDARPDIADVEVLVARLGAIGGTVAVAESLTGGAVCSRLVEVPGVSSVLRGGVVAYATDLKHRLLGVDADLLARHGAVHPDVAVQMARGVAVRAGSSWGVATTGVAGPGPQDGRPPGTVHIAVWNAGGTEVRSLTLPGGRAEVRAAAADAALSLLLEALQSGGAAGPPDAAQADQGP